jgi:hypothetical protein
MSVTSWVVMEFGIKQPCGATSVFGKGLPLKAQSERLGDVSRVARLRGSINMRSSWCSERDVLSHSGVEVSYSATSGLLSSPNIYFLSNMYCDDRRPLQPQQLYKHHKKLGLRACCLHGSWCWYHER